MAKAVAKSKIEIVEVQTPKVDNTIKLDEVMDQLATKSGGRTPAGTGAKTKGAASEQQSRIARIKELSAELAKELRTLQQSSGTAPKRPSAPRGRGK